MQDATNQEKHRKDRVLDLASALTLHSKFEVLCFFKKKDCVRLAPYLS